MQDVSSICQMHCSATTQSPHVTYLLSAQPYVGLPPLSALVTGHTPVWSGYATGKKLAPRSSLSTLAGHTPQRSLQGCLGCLWRLGCFGCLGFFELLQLGKCLLLLLLQGVRILLWLLLQRYYCTAPGAQIPLPLLIRQSTQMLLLLLRLQGAHMLLRLLLLQNAHMLLRLLLQGPHMLLLLQGAHKLVLLVLLHSARGLNRADKLQSAHGLHYIMRRPRLQVAPRRQGLHSLQQVLRLACVELACLQRDSLALQLHQLHALQLHWHQLTWQHLCWQ